MLWLQPIHCGPDGTEGSVVWKHPCFEIIGTSSGHRQRARFAFVRAIKPIDYRGKSQNSDGVEAYIQGN